MGRKVIITSTLGFLAAALLIAGALAFHYRHQRPELRSTASDGYAERSSCTSCHADIAKTYAQTGMGRSFHEMTAAGDGEDFPSGTTVLQRESQRWYSVFARDGRHYESRTMIGFAGNPLPTYEKTMDYVVGSGNHARTFLHRTPEGKLLELPVSWYREDGGKWAMSPGYDRAGQKDFLRTIGPDCLFCHNGYSNDLDGRSRPDDSPTHSGSLTPEDAIFPGNLPQGIDCQRCHGPGAAHVKAARTPGTSPEAVRAAIINPGNLTRERQLNVCMQCHLETTSLRLPNSIRRYDRPINSFRPGQALEDYAIYFDHKPGTGFDDRVEVAHQAYRLAKSKCFLNSEMTCTTCHDPHLALRGEAAQAHYIAVCTECHTGKHAQVANQQVTSTSNCLNCHMWKRRTDDVVHVVMTDHFIQRLKPKRDFLAPLKETLPVYRGEVVPYLPKTIAQKDDLYLATAQVLHEADLEHGIPWLRRDIEASKPSESRFYLDLASAYAKQGNNAEATKWFEDALLRDPDSPVVLRELTNSYAKSGDLVHAAATGERAASGKPIDTAALTNLGNIYLQLDRVQDAQRVLRQALAIDADLPDANNLMGLLWVRLDNTKAAEASFRTALTIAPDLVAALNNLGDLLAQHGRLREAAVYFERALAIDPTNADAHRSYALLLAMNRDFGKAAGEMKQAVALIPRSAAFHSEFADMLVANGQIPAAEKEYNEALRLDASLGEAHLGLGNILTAEGSPQRARKEFALAAQSRDPTVRQAALQAMH